MKKIITIITAFLMLQSWVLAEESSTIHALAISGTPKYGPDFTHFDYTNPDAPKGGSVVLDALGTFDSLNPFAIKGNVADGIGMLFETLTVASEDEPFARYGLLAENMEIPNTSDWIIFNLRKEAKFHDGKPVTADDIVYSFQTLTALSNPTYKRYYADITKVEKLSALQVKFTFKDGNNKELPLIIGEMPILPKHWWEKKDANQAFLDMPLGSGPYKVKELKPGKYITYERVKDYWGKDLAVNKGRYNFDAMKYDFYRDRMVGLEAFKAGEYDLRQENTAKSWATLYTGDSFDKKLIIKEAIQHSNPMGMQGFVFNTRLDIFSDKRVREALTYAFDFEWSNKNLFYDQYKRTKSYFENSDMASSGLPSKEELKLLEPLEEWIPKEVFTKEFTLPVTDGKGNIRKQLRKAARLLKEAGWKVINGKLMKDGKPFQFEMLLVLPDFERIVLPFKKNLEQLGIDMSVRTVDTSQYINRMRDYDFEMMVGSVPQSLSPGNEQRYFFHSSSADVPGTRNFMGIKNKAIDALVDSIIAAPEREELITRCRAMDRVLLWNYYMIPHFYINTYRIAYWNKFSRPKITPKYGLAFDTWWVDSQKAKKLFEAKPTLKRN